MTSNPSASVSPDLRSAAGDAVQRSKAYLLALPIGTLSVFVAVSLIFFIPLATLQLDSFNLALSLNPNSIIFSFQLWRLYTAHWINGNASQYILNVVAALPLFSLIEQRLGTMRFWSLLFSSSILIGTLYTLIALCLEAVVKKIRQRDLDLPVICV